MQNVVSERRLLARIARRGWTERLGQQFETVFGERIRWMIVATMERIGVLQWRIHPDRADCLEDRRLALYENTLSDLWYELVSGLVERYIKGVEEDRVHQDLVPYLRGVVRHLVIANARALRLIGRQTSVELLKSVCEAKREATYSDRLAWLKFCLEKKVREEILSRTETASFSRVYRRIHRVSDYFFEEFVPSQCERISPAIGTILDDLLDEFELLASSETTLEYIGVVTPVARELDDRVRAPEGEDEGEYLAVMTRAGEGRWQ